MRIELKVIETIEQYLMGTLSPNEKADFESQLTQNAKLKSQVDVQAQIMQGIQRMALKNATQTAYKSYKLQSFLTKAIIVAVIAAGATFGVMKLMENTSENTTPTEYHETQNQISFPANDSLAAAANQYLPQEVFKINTRLDTIIETNDGMVIYIPADAFNTSETQVDLLIQTATKPEDILMAGLSTVTANGQELETGGMFYVDAFVNGQRVDLKKQLTANVPTNELKTGMQLYNGEKNANGEIVWNNPKTLEKFLKPVDITRLDFYPPNYESSLNDMGYSKKDFMDSLYYSFACSESSHQTTAAIREHYNNVRFFDERGRSQLKDRIREADSMYALQSNNQNMPASVDEIVQIATKTLPLGDDNYQLEVIATIKNGWKIGSMNDVPALSGISNTEIYFSQSNVTFIDGPYEGLESSSTNINNVSSGTISHRFTYYVTSKNKAVLEATMVFMACGQGGCFPPKIKGLSFTLADGAGLDSLVMDYSCPGINPASVKTIWNSKFNNTNLATKEFEERMPWIHKSCNNAVLELYINNLDKKLSTVDSMAFKYLSGDVLEKFKYFAARGDGRVEVDNVASQKMSAYFEKQRDAEAKALAETQQQFWDQQTKLDIQNTKAENESANRANKNQAEIFQKEYKKNLCKVYDELQLNKDCNEPPATAGFTVQINNLGWKNIDRLVSEATAARQTTTFNQNGKTSTLTYNPWSATIKDFAKFERINVYSIPLEFNSYIKLPGVNGKYEYKLNADLNYQTVVLAWAADGIYFFKAPANPGDSNIALRKVSDAESRNEITASLKSVQGMTQELDYTQYMQQDEKRVNTNKEKTQLRQKIEPVVFPCGKDEIADTTVAVPWN